MSAGGTGRKLQDSLADFRDALTQDQRDLLDSSSSAPEASDVINLTEEISNENESRKSRRLAESLRPFLESALQFSGVVETLVSANPKISALVWGSVKFTILVAYNFSEYFEKLSHMFVMLGDHCPRISTFRDMFSESKKLQELVSVFFATVIDFCKVAVKIIQQKGLKQFRNLIWKPFDIKFKDIKSKIEDQKKEIDSEIWIASEVARHKERGLQVAERKDASTYRNERTLQRLLERGERDRKNQLMLNQEREVNRRLLLDRLSDYDHTYLFRQLRKKCYRNTGSWFFIDPEFERWNQGQYSGLWLRGIPGSGKSVLTSAVIDRFQAPVPSVCKKDASVAYFFCNYGDSKSLKATVIFGSLIKQMLKPARPETFLRIEDKISNLYHDNRIPDVEELSTLLESVVELLNSVYIIIDGIDECADSERVEILRCLKMLTESHKSKVNVLLASRDEFDIKKSLKDFHQISFTPASVSSDIQQYIEDVVKERLDSGDLVVADSGLIQEIEGKLVTGAEGMFLWVSFQINDICEAINDNEIRDILRSLPRGLNETYLRALQKIERRGRNLEVTRKAFQWLTCSKRPLSLNELREAIAIHPSHATWTDASANFATESSRIIQACANLVLIDEDQIIRLAHYTVREFFFSKSTETSLASVFFSVEQAERELGQVCMAYLNFTDFECQIAKTQPCQNIAVNNMPSVLGINQIWCRIANLFISREKVLFDYQKWKTSVIPPPGPSIVLGKKYHLLSYVCEYWVHHTKFFPSDDGELRISFRKLAIERKLPFKFTPWIIDDNSEDLTFRGVFYWAFENNHKQFLELVSKSGRGRILEYYTEMERQNNKPPLWVACFKGYNNVVEIFLNSRIRLNEDYCQGLTALQAAAEGGHAEVVKLLLSVGADINAKPGDDSGRTALQAAAEGGHIEVVKLLLSVGANFNANPGENGRKTLQAAAEGGHIEVVKLLLRRAGINIHATPGYDRGRTALQAAAEDGDIEVVKLLLSAGANVNADPGCNSGRTALQAAAEGGHIEVVKLLLSVGANVNASPSQYGDGRTALQAAAGGGHIEVVKLLLSVRANVNANPSLHGDGRKALQAAAGGGHIEVVKLLLSVGANVNASPSEYGQTALQAAAGGGHIEVVKLLLSVGANVNASPSRYDGRTALQAAAEGGHIEVVKLLLSVGANVNADPGSYVRTALQAAAGGGHIEVVKLLLSVGANVNASPSWYDGRTALQAAAGGGHIEVVKLLLSVGANVNVDLSEYGQRTLQAAAGGGHIEVVGILCAACAK